MQDQVKTNGSWVWVSAAMLWESNGGKHKVTGGGECVEASLYEYEYQNLPSVWAPNRPSSSSNFVPLELSEVFCRWCMDINEFQQELSKYTHKSTTLFTPKLHKTNSRMSKIEFTNSRTTTTPYNRKLRPYDMCNIIQHVQNGLLHYCGPHCLLPVILPLI